MSNRSKYRLFLMALLVMGITMLGVEKYNNSMPQTVRSSNEVQQKEVYAVGLPVGVYLHTRGVMVLDVQQVVGTDGKIQNPAENKIQKNDYITEFNGTKVYNKTQLQFLVEDNENNPAELLINRNGEIIEETIKPVKDSEGDYKIGIWVRDDAQGIGTLTYMCKNGNFGALGHGVSDIDTGKLLDSKDGRIYLANIWGIKKGEPGNPGGLCGSIDYKEYNILGTIYENCNIGLFGNITNTKEIIKENLDLYKVATPENINIGKAYIQMIENGEKKRYEIQIEKIVDSSITNDNSGKDFIIRIVDDRLLNKTNGIVQGMSGSPIIQNDNIVGAVTHVFVDDPTRGYGIFIEKMMEH